LYSITQALLRHTISQIKIEQSGSQTFEVAGSIEFSRVDESMLDYELAVAAAFGVDNWRYADQAGIFDFGPNSDLVSKGGGAGANYRVIALQRDPLLEIEGSDVIFQNNGIGLERPRRVSHLHQPLQESPSSEACNACHKRFTVTGNPAAVKSRLGNAFQNIASEIPLTDKRRLRVHPIASQELLRLGLDGC
jgi:hypothetical protein